MRDAQANWINPASDIEAIAVAVDRVSKTYPVPFLRLKKFFRRKFKPPVEALRVVSFNIRAGEIFGLIGPNGAGKTTLTKIIATLIQPTQGSATVNGHDTVRDDERVRRNVGLAGAEERSFYWRLTAEENLLFFARMYTVPHAHERVHELVRRVGLERRVHERVGALSRGQVQRVAWARAMLHAPHLLLLDEPDTGLDREGSELIDALLAEHIAVGGSILFTTHLLERVLQQSDRIVMLGSGRVVYNEETAGLDYDTLQRTYREVTS